MIEVEELERRALKAARLVKFFMPAEDVKVGGTVQGILLISNGIATAIGKWIGEVQGEALVDFSHSLKSARVLMDQANTLVATIDQAKDKQQSLLIANMLVNEARKIVVTSSAKAAMAIPNAVVEGFEKWEIALPDVVGRIAAEVRNTTIGIVVAGILGLVVWAKIK